MDWSAVLILTYAALTITVCWVASSEKSKGVEAIKQATSAMAEAKLATKTISEWTNTVSSLRAELRASDAKFKEFVDLILANDVHNVEIRKKLEWLEVKANAKAVVQPPIKIEPIEMRIVYRESKPKPVLTPKQTNEILKKVGKQVKQF